jgi:hypothetical protein
MNGAIENHEQFEVVRSQPVHAETALACLKRDVLPKNERMYGLMSESYIDLVLSLRRELDEYFGIRQTHS